MRVRVGARKKSLIKTARLTEINLSSPVHGQQFYKLRVGRNETIGLNGPGYVYRYADLQWIWQLGR